MPQTVPTEETPSPDDREFEQIYQNLPPGLVVVACGGGPFRPLQSFCFSLKGAAIRKGSDAVHYPWDCSHKNWDNLGGVRHFSDFIGQHAVRGVRLFLIDSTPRSGSLTQRAAELVRSPMATGPLDRDIVGLIHQEALSKGVTVIVTALAEVVAMEQVQKTLEDLDSAIRQREASLNQIRDGLGEIERQFQLPDAEAAIAALPKEGAEQMREAREALPRLRLAAHEVEAQIAELNQARKRANRLIKSPSQLLTSLKTSILTGSWKGILLEQHRVDDDWYSATVATGNGVERFGPLYLTWECPQAPVALPQPESRAPSGQAPADATVQRRPSWLRRLFGRPGE
jgi:chaperonin cofactor prefoldin